MNNYPLDVTDADIGGNDYQCPNCGETNPDLDSFWLTDLYKGQCCPGIKRLYADTFGESYVIWRQDIPHCRECDEACEYVYMDGKQSVGCENCLEVTNIGEILERKKR